MRIGAHSGNVLAVTSLIFIAGVFTGILSGTGMADAMAKNLPAVIPYSFGPYLAVFTARRLSDNRSTCSARWGRQSIS